MRIAAITMLSVGALGLAFAGAPGPATAPPATIDLDRPFRLRPGDSAVTTEGALRVGFDRVTTDSRCPRRERCVWAGDAVVRVWVQRGSDPRQLLDLHTTPGASQAAGAYDHELRLLQLDPHPVAGQAMAPDGYSATLSLRRGTTTAPER